ncbi:MAG TPA: DUF4145 domain-containing protein [Verrucomicrobiae bacterium]|nr:DUF4145 domain-containing protein [Verrucomicrobiae bacterium]
MTPYTPPGLNKSAFHCPHCNAFANHTWSELIGSSHGNIVARLISWRVSVCMHCNQFTIWQSTTMIYPDSSLAPLPNSDLPADIAADFQEARSIVQRSPRGAAALFRLCIQKLCIHLGEPGKNINADIAALVKKGLNPKIQKSLDVVRVIGNESVHPGTIDLRDQPQTAVQLATLINIIADAMITQPKLVDELYGGLPEAKREEIKKRDS